MTVSSGAHRIGRIHFDDLQGARRYNNWLAYGQSKLANLLFCFELQRRAVAAGTPLLSASRRTRATRGRTCSSRRRRWHEQMIMRVTNPLIGPERRDGGAADAVRGGRADIPGGSFVGPNGFMEQRGYPHIVTAAARAYDEADRRRLWEMSEQLTGVHVRVRS